MKDSKILFYYQLSCLSFILIQLIVIYYYANEIIEQVSFDRLLC